MLKRSIEIPNGNTTTKVSIYECDKCKAEIDERNNRYIKEEPNVHYCSDCALKLGKINSTEYLEGMGIYFKGIHAAPNPEGSITIWFGKVVPPWERDDQEQRNTVEYSKWRKEVYERDKYTCQKCGQVGGELNAHHIKSFSKFPKKRFDLDNGITLCVDCHRKEHRKEFK